MGEYMLDMCLILCTGAMDGIANPYAHCVCGFAGLGLYGKCTGPPQYNQSCTKGNWLFYQFLNFFLDIAKPSP